MKKIILLLGIVMVGTLCTACVKDYDKSSKSTIDEELQSLLNKRIESIDMLSPGEDTEISPDDPISEPEQIQIKATKSLKFDNFGTVEKVEMAPEDVKEEIYSYSYNDFVFALCQDQNGTYHITYKEDETLTSLMEFTTDIDAYLSNEEESGDLNGFESFDNILGSSGAVLKQIIGASCIFEVYIAVNNDSIDVLLSTSTSGGLIVYDLDKDGSDELLSHLDGYFYEENEEEIYLNQFDIGTEFTQLMFNQKRECYELLGNDGIAYNMVYDSEQSCLIQQAMPRDDMIEKTE